MQKPYQLDHQDWTPVVFTKKRDRDPEVQKAISTLEPKHKRALNDNPEVFANKMFEKEYIQRVLQKRCENKWTQKDLAQRLNVDVAIIQRFEQGKEVYNDALKNKINRTLNMS